MGLVLRVNRLDYNISNMSTFRQILAASKMVENGGNMGKAMIEAGYSKAMAKNPYKLTRSRGWFEAIDGILFDDKLVQIHNELLDAEKIVKTKFPLFVSDKKIHSIIESGCEAKVAYIEELKGYKNCYYLWPDNSARLRAVELGYKLKGYLNHPPKTSQLSDADDRELRECIERTNRVLPLL